MNAKIKSTLFAAFLVVTNWHWTRTVVHNHNHSSTTVNLAGAGIGVVICIVGLIVYSRRLYRLLRDLLDRGTRVPAKVKFVSAGPMFILFLLFLLPSYSRTSSIPAGEITTTTTFGYGSGASGFLIILAVLLLTVYQFYRGLKEYAEP
ncbi:MAG: hypothetical protein ACFUZC_18635 [Chthoniobacteraceae bacterium]